MTALTGAATLAMSHIGILELGLQYDNDAGQFLRELRHPIGDSIDGGRDTGNCLQRDLGVPTMLISSCANYAPNW